MEFWWCNSHERQATLKQRDRYVCQVGLGGITLPCFTVNLTGIVEIDSPEITMTIPPVIQKSLPSTVRVGRIN